MFCSIAYKLCSITLLKTLSCSTAYKLCYAPFFKTVFRSNALRLRSVPLLKNCVLFDCLDPEKNYNKYGQICLTFISGGIFASSCFRKKISVSLTQLNFHFFSVYINVRFKVAHNLNTTSYQRRCDAMTSPMTSHRRCHVPAGIPRTHVRIWMSFS